MLENRCFKKASKYIAIFDFWSSTVFFKKSFPLNKSQLDDCYFLLSSSHISFLRWNQFSSLLLFGALYPLLIQYNISFPNIFICCFLSSHSQVPYKCMYIKNFKQRNETAAGIVQSRQINKLLNSQLYGPFMITSEHLPWELWGKYHLFYRNCKEKLLTVCNITIRTLKLTSYSFKCHLG